MACGIALFVEQTAIYVCQQSIFLLGLFTVLAEINAETMANSKFKFFVSEYVR